MSLNLTFRHRIDPKVCLANAPCSFFCILSAVCYFTRVQLSAAIALRRTSANSSRSGAWGEVRTAAARMTGTRTRTC